MKQTIINIAELIKSTLYATALTILMIPLGIVTYYFLKYSLILFGYLIYLIFQ